MSTRPSKKPALKKETLRTLESAELPQLDGAVGGATPGFGVIDIDIGNSPSKTVQPTVGPRTRTL
ncbi:hypothetical protein [Myxococcus qinghaiensis]|uniref:hypothetical protein n=1 Tax=Myxococcus qinghaiensis TaxID=2906758 RepID=UPI0020A78CAB|nr:hypothetical protein [Myxococcus qinghaiensis]MCP3166667.1 hypothetical protein [Myxococcus qinghaiensis]